MIQSKVFNFLYFCGWCVLTAIEAVFVFIAGGFIVLGLLISDLIFK